MRTRVAFSDTDAQGIVYYGRYNPYFDLARVEYLRRLDLLRRGEEGTEFVMRANVVEYFAPAVFDDEIEVFCRVARIGRTSVTYEFGRPTGSRTTCSWSRRSRRSSTSTSPRGAPTRSGLDPRVHLGVRGRRPRRLIRLPLSSETGS